MAVNLGTSNTTRYYSAADHADFSLPNGDWSRIAIVQVQASANPRYIFSTNGFGVANSFNLIISSGSNMVGVRVNTNALWETGAAPPNGTWIVMYATRRSDNLYCGWAQIGGSSVTESAGQSLTAGSDGSVMYFGARSDLDTNRFWLGGMAGAFFSNSYGVTTAEILEIAKGAPVMSVIGHKLNFAAHFHSSSPATITGLIGGKTLTKNGSGWADLDELMTIYPQSPSLVEASASGNQTLLPSLFSNSNTFYTHTLVYDQTLSPSLFSNSNAFYAHTITQDGLQTLQPSLFTNTNTFYAATVSQILKGASITLYDVATPQASLSSLQVVWFDQQEPKDFTTIVYQTASESTDGSGVLEINLHADTSLSIGQSGFLLVYQLDGVNHEDSLVFAGRVAVSNIS